MKTHIQSQVLVNEVACIAYSLLAVLQSPIRFLERKQFDPLHFPDLAECEATRILSEHLAAVEEFDKLFAGQQGTETHEKHLMEMKELGR